MTVGALIADRYRVVGVLGGGAMADVYEVIDESRGVTLALKRLLPERVKGRLAALLLQREYETLSQLSHPLIIRAFDYGVDGHLPFYTMERLVGRSLGELSPLPWRAAASLLRDVASALSLVHSRRLVHRDVSSRNVCETADHRAKLIDFGALSPMGPPREIIGTPPFLSPESLEQRPLDARTDLFSLGALAYLALTGKHAYPARRITELGELWPRRVEPPSSIAKDVPAVLDALVLSLIDLNPLVRPRSAADVWDRLTSIAGLSKAEAPETARAYFLTPALVARAEHTRRFRRRLLRAERGRGGTLLIEAPRGGGRSRLLSSFLLDARLRGILVVSADSNHEGATPFGVVRAMARSFRDAEPAQATQLVASEPALARILALETDEGATPSIAPESWVSATERISRWFVELSRRRPLVVGVDELDACDGPSGAVIAALCAAASTEALLVVATSVARSEAPSTVRMREGGSSLLLQPFGLADTRELLSSVFGDVPHLDGVVGWVQRLSGGLPRTALELAQHLVDVGVARYGEAGWALPATLQDLGLPEGVDAALDARVAALSPGARRIAEALSLTSDHDPLYLEEYAALLDETAKREIFLHLNELVSAAVLVDVGPTYAFSCAEARAAVRRRVAPEALPALHRRIAEAYQSGPEPPLDLAAFHLLEAGDAPSAFTLFALASKDRASVFARGMSFARTPDGSRMVEQLYAWGRANGAVGKEMSLVIRGLIQVSSVGDARLAVHAPEILASLSRDSGLGIWAELTEVADPLERIQRAIGEAYGRYASADDREQRLDPGEAITELSIFCTALIGVYARSADQLGATALDKLVRPLRVLSPVLDIVSRLLELAARALRGVSTRELRVEIAEKTREPVPGLDEAARSTIFMLSLYYLSLEDMTQGHAVPDGQLSPLDGSPPFAPLAWQARMLREYYRGDEKKAEACRKRRDVAMTGRADVDGHLETSVLYEAGAYATLGNLVGLRGLLPEMKRRAAERPGWLPHYRLAVANCHFLRGDHQSAVQEYEGALALPHIESHAAHALILVRLVRSLVELGRFEAAREKAQAALARHEVEPLMPFYFDGLEIALARAEAGAGLVSQAVERARRCMTRVEERGLSGVVFVGFLVESAILAHGLGDNARFEELTSKVGVLVAGVDSTALATQHARLLSMRRSNKFETAVAPIGEALIVTEHTALASNVRTELERCRGPLERSLRALRFLLTYSGAARGYLYLYRTEQLELAAAIPNDEPEATLDERLKEWAARAFEGEGLTTTASLDALSAAPPSSPFSFVELVFSSQSGIVLAGVAALSPSRGALSRVPDDVLRTVGEELIRSGDASGRTIFAPHAD